MLSFREVFGWFGFGNIIQNKGKNSFVSQKNIVDIFWTVKTILVDFMFRIDKKPQAQYFVGIIYP